MFGEEQPYLVDLVLAEANCLAVPPGLLDLGLPVDRVWLAHPCVDLLAALGVVAVPEERVRSVVEIGPQAQHRMQRCFLRVLILLSGYLVSVQHATHPTRFPARRVEPGRGVRAGTPLRRLQSVPERLDRVAIATSREVIELSWASRDSLLHEIRNLGESAKPIRTAFEAVGASRPVELSRNDQTKLFTAIEQWADSVTVAALPPGIWRLRCALVDQVDNADRQSRGAPEAIPEPSEGDGQPEPRLTSLSRTYRRSEHGDQGQEHQEEHGKEAGSKDAEGEAAGQEG